MFENYIIEFDHEKNLWLQQNRGICFDDIIPLMQERLWLDIIEHPDSKKYPNQLIIFFDIENQCYVVPFEINDTEQKVILKTVYPSRKARKIYLIGEDFNETK